MAVTAAHYHDVTVGLQTLDAIIVKRPRPMSATPQHLCADKGYDSATFRVAVRTRGYISHIRHRGEAARKHQHHPARRWVVERTASWHNRFRKLLVRFEKRVENYLGLVHLACTLIIYRLTVLG